MDNKRPILVTIICILGFIGVPLQILGSLFTMIPDVTDIVGQLVPLWYSILSILFAIAYLVGLLFIWKMKKWALIFYTVLAVVEYGIMFTIGIGSILMLVISAIFIGLLWTQFKKMS